MVETGTRNPHSQGSFPTTVSEQQLGGNVGPESHGCQHELGPQLRGFKCSWEVRGEETEKSWASSGVRGACQEEAGPWGASLRLSPGTGAHGPF